MVIVLVYQEDFNRLLAERFRYFYTAKTCANYNNFRDVFVHQQDNKDFKHRKKRR